MEVELDNLKGLTLTRTSLVLQMQGYLSHLKGLVELDPKEGDPGRTKSQNCSS